MAAEPDTLKIYFLDVGQGDSTFIVPPAGQGDPILFDCADQYVAERFVSNHGIQHLHAVVASHLDKDHIGGLLGFLKGHFEARRRVERLVMFADRALGPGKNQRLRALMAHALHWERHPPHEGFVLKASLRDGEGPLRLLTGPDWSVDLILPFVGQVSNSLLAGGEQPNLCSAVLRVERGGTAVLIGGDAPLASWERVEPLLPARVIRTPHHGGAIGDHVLSWRSEPELYDRVNAEVAVISVGTGNSYRHPTPPHAAAARRGGACRLLCTQLTPRCHDDPGELRDEALLQAGAVEYPYRHRVVPGHPRRSRPGAEVPCAGTVCAWLTSTGALHIEPALGGDHDRLLMQVEHPLCGG